VSPSDIGDSDVGPNYSLSDDSYSDTFDSNILHLIMSPCLHCMSHIM